MRLLHIISTVNPAGGGPIEGVRQRGMFLEAEGHSVEVLSLDSPESPHVRNFALRVHAMGPGKGGFGYAPRMVEWLKAHASEYDHIVINGLWQYHGWAASRVLKNLGKPYHLFTHGMLDPWFKHAYPLKHLKKYIYWLLAESHVVRGARKVLFTCEEEMLRAAESFTPYQANGEVVPYGTSNPPDDSVRLRARFFDRYPDLKGKRLFTFLSRVHEKKGCDLLIQAFSQVARENSEIHLVIAGPVDDVYRSKLQALVDEASMQGRISWLGMVTGDDKWAALHAAEVFVLPSHQENFGIAVAEALGCGRAVLISDKVNIWRELLADRVALVEPDTLEGTVSNFKVWLGLPEGDRQKMGENALKTFNRRYTIEAMAHGLVSALEN